MLLCVIRKVLKDIVFIHFHKIEICTRSGFELSKAEKRLGGHHHCCVQNTLRLTASLRKDPANDKFGIPSKKCLKPDAVPTIFPKPTHGSKPAATHPSRPAAEKRQCQAVSNIAIAIKLCINGY